MRIDYRYYKLPSIWQIGVKYREPRAEEPPLSLSLSLSLSRARARSNRSRRVVRRNKFLIKNSKRYTLTRKNISRIEDTDDSLLLDPPFTEMADDNGTRLSNILIIIVIIRVACER